MNNPTTPAEPSALEQLLTAYAEFHSPEAVARITDLSDRAEAMEAAGRWARRLPQSLADVLADPERWSAVPSFHRNGYVSPAAFAYLGHGVWLHHTQDTRGFGHNPEVTLLAPCRCGKGYQQFEVTTEDDLVGTLAALAGAARLAGEVGARPDCDDDGSCRSSSSS